MKSLNRIASISGRLIKSTAVLLLMLLWMMPAVAQADWADQMGESSGVDRAVMMTGASASGSGTAAVLQSADTEALRDSIAGNINREMSSSLGTAFTPAAFTSNLPSVPSIGAGDPDAGDGGLF